MKDGSTHPRQAGAFGPQRHASEIASIKLGDQEPPSILLDKHCADSSFDK
jgi:hypothetical protein